MALFHRKADHHKLLKTVDITTQNSRHNYTKQVTLINKRNNLLLALFISLDLAQMIDF